MKCVNCKNCVNYENGYYWCLLGKDMEAIEECVANDEKMYCDLYVPELDANDTKA